MIASSRSILEKLPLLGLLLMPTMAAACIWIHGTTLDGRKVQEDGAEGPFPQQLERRIDERPEAHTRLVEAHTYDPKDPVAMLNDEAVQVLLKGDAAHAVTLLEKVEADHPGTYFTAANLGTAMELSGRDADALRWILEGIRRNPNSHMRTEWLHARILEAKLNLAADPSWLKSHTISGINVARLGNDIYHIESLQGLHDRTMLRNALENQLETRMLFVKPKDAVVAQLLVELSHVESHVGILEHALAYLDIAERYGASPKSLASFRQAMNATINRPPSLFDKLLRIRRSDLLAGLMIVLIVVTWGIKRRLLSRRKRARVPTA